MMLPKDTDRRPCFSIFKAVMTHDIALQHGISDPQELHIKLLEIWMNSTQEYKSKFSDPTMVSRKPVPAITLDIEDSPKLKFHYYQPKVEMPKPLVKYPKLFPNTFIRSHNTNRSPTIGMKSPSSYSSTSERAPMEMTSLQHSEIAGGMMCHGVSIRIPTVSPDVLEATRVDLADVQNTTEYQDSIHNIFNPHCI